jgi:TrmH family RNA methyltransferase
MQNAHLSELIANITIVLVNPGHPGNIGAVARAMNNMGFHKLILVNPVAYTEETFWLAHASEHIVKKAEIATDLKAVLARFDHIYATSNVPKEGMTSAYLRESCGEIIRRAKASSIAILFGREDKGLFMDELKLAEKIIKIPSATAYPALNLSQAVMVVLYELFVMASQRQPTELPAKDLASFAEKEDLIAHFGRSLETLKYAPKQKEIIHQNMIDLFRTFINDGNISEKQVRFFHKYLAEIDNFARYRRESGQ